MYFVKTFEGGKGGIELLEGKHRRGENDGIGPSLVSVIHHVHVSTAQKTAAHGAEFTRTQQPPRETVIDPVLQILVVDVALENAGHRLLVIDRKSGPSRTQNHFLLGFRHISLEGRVGEIE